MEQHPHRPFPGLGLLWLIVGSAMVGIPIWLGLTRFRPILAGHPVMVATAFGSIVIGVFAVILGAVAVIDRLRPASPSARSERRATLGRRRLARIASVPALVVCIAAVLLLGYSRPLGADSTAIQAMQTQPTVAVHEGLTSFDLVPTRQDARGRAIAVEPGWCSIRGPRSMPAPTPHCCARWLRPAIWSWC